MTTSRLNLGPLTTAFAYPGSCTVAVQQCDTCDVFWQAQTCSNNAGNTQGVQDDPQCWPSRENPSISTGEALLGWGFYSPGSSCPTGYATSCVATGTVNGGFPFQFPLLESETAVGCCPTGFRCKFNPGVDGAQTCYSIASTGSFAAVHCSSGTSNGFNYYGVPTTATATGGISTATEGTSTTVISVVTIYAPLFQLLYQSTDLPSVQPASTTSTAISSSITSTTTTIPAPSSSQLAEGGLSTGAKAGIGVGAGIAGLALLGAAVFFFFRRRREPAHVSEIMTPEPKPQFPQQFPQQGVQPVELSPYTHRSELSS
ncbi:hypothetical protein F5Y19DRAFT_412738 [Xylariaceae sp. FL1651]|nr:hypothetical protein F5Y19DRAFT_412738 [Xylariaceae sp. FL1651]